MKLLFFQYGNFAEDHRRLISGGAETYRDQRLSVDYIAGLADRYDVTVISIGESFDIRLSTKLRSIGITNEDAFRPGVTEMLDAISPDRLICRTPHIEVLKWAVRNKVSTLPNFADIFRGGGIKGRVKTWGHRRLLSAKVFPCISNHSLNASRSLVDIVGLPSDLVIPWDWTRLETRDPSKRKTIDPTAPHFFYAGGIEESKGVGDCLDALAKLRAHDLSPHMAFAGPGDLERWRKRAEALGVGAQVEFLGLLPHPDVRRFMEGADAVVVSSRHSYGEGLPNTIYEALAAATPLIVSDHPAFQGRLKPNEECVMFRAADSEDLADAMRRVSLDRALADRLSAAAAETHDRLYVGMEWPDLVDAYLNDPENKTGWVQRNSMAALGL